MMTDSTILISESCKSLLVRLNMTTTWALGTRYGHFSTFSYIRDYKLQKSNICFSCSVKQVRRCLCQHAVGPRHALSLFRWPVINSSNIQDFKKKKTTEF